MIDLDVLRVVSTIAESGSFREAAQKLNVSPPAITRAVKAAESYAGTALFMRSRHGASLTSNGRAFLEHGRALLAQADTFETGVSSIRQSGGRLVIGCGPLPTTTIISPLIGEVAQQWEALEIGVQVKADIDPVLALRRGEVDLFIGDMTHTTAFEELEIMLLRRHPMQIVAAPGHPIFTAAPCTLADLVRHKVALPFLHRYWRRTFATDIQADTGSKANSETRLQQVTCDDYTLLAELARSEGFVAGGCPEHFADSLATGKLREVPMKQPIYWNMCAARLGNASSAALDNCWDWLAANWQQAPGGA